MNQHNMTYEELQEMRIQLNRQLKEAKSSTWTKYYKTLLRVCEERISILYAQRVQPPEPSNLSTSGQQGGSPNKLS